MSVNCYYSLFHLKKNITKNMLLKGCQNTHFFF